MKSVLDLNRKEAKQVAIKLSKWARSCKGRKQIKEARVKAESVCKKLRDAETVDSTKLNRSFTI